MIVLCGSYASIPKRNIIYIFLHNVSGPYIKSETTNSAMVQTLMTTQTESTMKKKRNAR